MLDASPIDATIFTEDFTSSATKSLVIDTGDVSKVGSYDFLVTAYYDIQPTIFVTTQF